jgi:hypothetical protein
MIPDEDAALDSLFLDPATRGDWDELINHIEDGGKITNEMRKFVVGVLRGTIKRPSNRPRTQAKIREHIRMAGYVWQIQKTDGRDKAIVKAAERFGIARRTMERILKDAETVSTRHTTIGPDGKVTVKRGSYRTKHPSAKPNKIKEKRRRSG